MKAGVTIVTFDEKDNVDALHSSLRESGTRGFIFSPGTIIDPSQNTTRESYLHKLMPELKKLYPGDALNLSAYPQLK